MKKVVSSILIGFFLSASLVSASPVTIRFAFRGGSLDQQTYQKRIEAFQKANPDIRVNPMNISGDYNQKIQVMVAAHEAPDVLWVSERSAVFAAAGAIIPLDDSLKAYGVDTDSRYDPSVLRTYQYKGKLYGLPDRAGAMVLYYNKTLFDKAKLPYPTGDWTWADLVKTGDVLTVRNASGKASQWGFAVQWGWWAWTWAFLFQNGGHVFDAEGQLDLVTPANVEAMQFYQDLFYKYKITPTPSEFSALGLSGPDPLFAQGKAAMVMTGGWLMSDLKTAGFEWNIAPVFKNKRPGTAPFGSALAVSSQTKYKDAAMKFISWMTSGDGQTWISKMKEDAPANKVNLREEFPKAFRISGRNLDLTAFTQVDRYFDLPRSASFGDIDSAFSTAIQRMIIAKEDPRKTLESLQDELDGVTE